MRSLNRKICNYIAKEWIGDEQPKTQFALNHNIEEKTVRRIYSDKTYTISLLTLSRICEARGVGYFGVTVPPFSVQMVPL